MGIICSVDPEGVDQGQSVVEHCDEDVVVKK